MTFRALAVASLLLPGLASARDLSAGTFQLGGDGSISFSRRSSEIEGNEGDDIDTLRVRASGFYYLVPNLGLGAFLEYLQQSTEVVGDDLQVSTVIVGPQVSYNLALAERLSAFGTVGAGWAKSEAEVGDVSSDISGLAWQLGGGLRFFPARSVSIDGSVSYLSLNLEDDEDRDIDSSELGVRVGLSFYFGGNP